MNYCSPIINFINNELNETIKDFALDYSVLTSGKTNEFYNLLSIKQKMNKLPTDLLQLFTKKLNRVHILNNDSNKPSIDDIQNILIMTDERTLNSCFENSYATEKQLYYFSLKSEKLSYIIQRMKPFIIRGFFTNSQNNQSYFILLNKELAFGYIPDTKQNNISTALITLSQGPATLLAIPEKELSFKDLENILKTVTLFLNSDV